MDAKMRLMNETGKKDGSILFLIPAIDNAFSQYMKRSTVSESKISIWVQMQNIPNNSVGYFPYAV